MRKPMLDMILATHQVTFYYGYYENVRLADPQITHS